jgi:hypothetical protein
MTIAQLYNHRTHKAVSLNLTFFQAVVHSTYAVLPRDMDYANDEESMLLTDAADMYLMGGEL